MNEALFPIEAERALIGNTLTARTLEAVSSIVLASDFSNLETRAAYEAIHEAWTSGRHFDPITVSEAHGTPNLETLNEWINIGSISGLPLYAETIAKASQLRELLLGITTVASSINAAEIDDPDEAIGQLSNVVANHRQLSAGEGIEVVPMAEFLQRTAEEPERHEWLLPNFIRRRWRIVIAGEEGIGKMVLLRQIGHCLAAGIHPFRPGTTTKPCRVLFVDVENPADTIADQTKLISNQHDLVAMSEGRLFIHSNEAGMNLAQPGDRRRFERIVAQAQPDVLVAGPLYKLSRRQTGGHSDWDADAMDLINFFDDIRTRYNCALLLEHHLVKSGQNAHFRSTDQGGSAMFRRWPEMSFSMIEDPESGNPNTVKLHRYRRARNVETWPDRIERRPPGATQTGLAWSPIWNR